MEQIILHLIGDYLTQSSWMALNKTKRWWPAIAHATVYSLPFLLVGSWQAVLVIWSTHAVIDRFRLARFVCWAKDFMAPRRDIFESLKDRAGGILWDNRRNLPWSECSTTGYPPTTPDFLAVWLMIICDNTIHLAINYAALRWM